MFLSVWLMQGFAKSSVPVRISVYIIKIFLSAQFYYSEHVNVRPLYKERDIRLVRCLRHSDTRRTQWSSKDDARKLSYIIRSLWYHVVIKFSLMIFCAILKMAWESQPFILVPLKWFSALHNVSWEASECTVLPSAGDKNIHLCFTFGIGWQAVH